MWLNAFIPKSGTISKIGVPGVPGVPLPREASEHESLGVPSGRNTQITPEHIDTTGYSSDALPRTASFHAGFAVSGTHGTPGTLQKNNKPENKAYITDLVREFIEVNRMTLAETQALAAVAVSPTGCRLAGANLRA